MGIFHDIKLSIIIGGSVLILTEILCTGIKYARKYERKRKYLIDRI